LEVLGSITTQWCHAAAPALAIGRSGVRIRALRPRRQPTFEREVSLLPRSVLFWKKECDGTPFPGTEFLAADDAGTVDLAADHRA
jgi:hypothetical protein